MRDIFSALKIRRDSARDLADYHWQKWEPAENKAIRAVREKLNKQIKSKLRLSKKSRLEEEINHKFPQHTFHVKGKRVWYNTECECVECGLTMRVVGLEWEMDGVGERVFPEFESIETEFLDKSDGVTRFLTCNEVIIKKMLE